jgi:cellulose synthase/poly-beta-1,6-N-acetylglucosamine synthase-like glycosyltransferase
MPAQHYAGAGAFWCGSTSLLRVKALRDVGGVATETITEDMHTTLKLIRLGWKTAYHHQTLAVGLAPAPPAQYLLQRRRWGMGAMQILTHEPRVRPANLPGSGGRGLPLVADLA